MSFQTTNFGLFGYDTTGTDLTLKFDLAAAVTDNFTTIDAKAVSRYVSALDMTGSYSTSGSINANSIIAVGGSAAAPSITFRGDSDTGFSRPTANNIVFSTGGAEIFRLNSAQKIVVGNSVGVQTRFGTGTVVPTLNLSGDSSNDNSVLGINQFSADTTSGRIIFSKSRSATLNTTTSDGHSAVSSGDQLGTISFDASDGTSFRNVAGIRGIADSTATSDNVAGRLSFFTRPTGASGVLTERVRIDGSGVVRITNLTTGTVYSDASGNLNNTSSDIRLKTNVEPILNSLNIIKSLNPVKFNWIDTEKFGEQREIGFIAQEVEKFVPEVIGTNYDGMKSLEYSRLVSLLTGAIQEQQTIIESLIKRIETLEKK